MNISLRSGVWIILAAVGLTALAVFDSTNVLRGVIALAALVLPLCVLLLTRLPRWFGGLARATVAVAASIGVLMVAAIALNLTPAGLTPLTWLAFAIIVLVIALVGARPTTLHSASLPWEPHEALLGATAVAMVFGAFVLARAFVNVPPESFTELWMLTDNAATPSTLTVGVRSSELEPLGYRLELVAGGRVIRQWSLGRLDPGQTWQQRFDPQVTGEVQARLYRTDAPSRVYRHVTVTLPRTSAVRG